MEKEKGREGGKEEEGRRIREEKKERRKEGFKLAHMTVGANKFKFCRVGQQVGNLGRIYVIVLRQSFFLSRKPQFLL